ncbi:TetR family transcriptional regulator C-terminal domain-containing protein [Bradyrhizobium sp. NBAIM08]|nr:TetR family transcriptional regulator C-terminal domain-containing protein [Bradyrhizobium sp. NBAIM08]
MLLRLYPLYRAFEQAAAVDAQVAHRWREYQERRRQDVRRVVEAVESAGALRPGLDPGRAADSLWALVGWHPVALLVEQGGWSREEVERWIEDLFVTVLLGPAAQSS